MLWVYKFLGLFAGNTPKPRGKSLADITHLKSEEKQMVQVVLWSAGAVVCRMVAGKI